jgi:hypothetical protein
MVKRLLLAELDARMDPEFGTEQGGDAGGRNGNDEGDANNDAGARVSHPILRIKLNAQNSCCPGISHTHKQTNYIKYHHGVSYITINNIT